MSELRQTDKKKSLLFYYFCFFIVALSVLGGANENHWMANVTLLYLAAPLFASSVYKLMTKEKLSEETTKVLPWLSMAFLLPFLQLVPLPEHIWRALPFHDIAARALLAAGINHPTGSLSLAPNLTWVGLLSTLPSLSIFLAMLLFNLNEKISITRVILICGIINAFFGLLQVSQNSDAAAYLYPGLSAGDAVGFFKNRNHLASQMYALLPFAILILLESLNLNTKSSRRRKIIKNYPLFLLGLTCIFVFIVTCIFARSRAGVIILMLALIGISFLPDWKNIRFSANESGKRIYSKAFGFLIGFSFLFSLEYGFFRIMQRFENDSLYGIRAEIARNTLNATSRAFPYGTGLGTFQKIYSVIEPIEDVVPHKFVNHAHNDFLELFLETGAAGLLIVMGFMFWYIRHLLKAWRHPNLDSRSLYMTRASCIAIGLLLLHSFFDYPLRTHILMGLFALCCALLVSSDAEIETDNNDQFYVNSEQNTDHSHVERQRRRSKTRRRIKLAM